MFAFNLDVERTLRQPCKCNPYRRCCITPVKVALSILIGVVFLQSSDVRNINYVLYVLAYVLGYRLTQAICFYFLIYIFFKTLFEAWG